MSDTNVQLEVARITLRQAVLVAVISGLTGVGTAMIGTQAWRPKEVVLSSAIPVPLETATRRNDVQITADELRRLRDSATELADMRSQLFSARAQLAEALKQQPDLNAAIAAANRSNAALASSLESTRAELSEATRAKADAISRLEASEARARALDQSLNRARGEVGNVTRERDAAITNLARAPQISLGWYNTSLEQSFCSDRAVGIADALGGTNVKKVGNGTSVVATKGSSQAIIQCLGTPKLVIVATSGRNLADAASWREKLQDSLKNGIR